MILRLLIATCLLPIAVAPAAEPLALVVMDPLSKPLSCDCVRGYAQREYGVLADYLAEKLGREVSIAWNGSLVRAVEESGRPADVAIGKYSVVAVDAARVGRAMSPVAALTGQDGLVTQRGLIVVRADDSATDLADLAGYRVFFGPADEAEKSTAAEKLLASAGVAIPEDRERFGACSEAAVKLLELPADAKACAVISSYAAPLLEGCGSVKQGDLRVVAETEEVPFVTAFVADDLDAELKETVTEALLLAAAEPEVLLALETLLGFVPVETDKAGGDAVSGIDAVPPLPRPGGEGRGEGVPAEAGGTAAVSSLKSESKEIAGPRPVAAAGRRPLIRPDGHLLPLGGGEGPEVSINDNVTRFGPDAWPQFRGPDRDGVVPALPASLPAANDYLWQAELPSEGLGGLAVADGVLVVGLRDAADGDDLFRGYDAADGTPLWEYRYAAPGRLDYGSSPRATPLIDSGLVVTLGAFGRVACLDLATGVPLWDRDLVADFDGAMPEWGYSASPLLIDDLLILEPGGPAASVVALDLVSGSERWRSPGARAVYTSPAVIKVGDERRLVGRDGVGPVARELTSGGTTWRHLTGGRHEFGVPSPVATDHGVLFASETHGLRLFAAEPGRLARAPAATLDFRASDSHTPVAVGDRLYIADGRFRLHALDLADDLKTVWTLKDRALKGHVTIIAAAAAADRLLLLARDGALMIVEDTGGEGTITARVVLAPGTGTAYSHPAVVEDRLYVRCGRVLNCYRLG